mmetsp:Transcript_42524/g.78820  ORF Transcript_42524/g.78820 Transcript_42524/m.78820 type:complete len:219 (+) Transcript_42524:97-753(+)
MGTGTPGQVVPLTQHTTPSSISSSSCHCHQQQVAFPNHHVPNSSVLRTHLQVPSLSCGVGCGVLLQVVQPHSPNRYLPVLQNTRNYYNDDDVNHRHLRRCHVVSKCRCWHSFPLHTYHLRQLIKGTAALSTSRWWSCSNGTAATTTSSIASSALVITATANYRSDASAKLPLTCTRPRRTSRAASSFGSARIIVLHDFPVNNHNHWEDERTSRFLLFL